MTMQKVRVKALRNTPYAMHSPPPCKRRDRVTAAITQKWTLKEAPDHIRELIIERVCLRAEICAISERDRENKKSGTSVLIAKNLKRIDQITTQLNERKLHK